MDKTLITAFVFVVLGFTPVAWVERLIGFGYFGPIAWSAILSMVGVLFGLIALLRSIDLKDPTLRNAALVALVLGLGRLFIAPMFA